MITTEAVAELISRASRYQRTTPIGNRTKFVWDMSLDLLAMAARGEDVSGQSVQFAIDSVNSVMDGNRSSKPDLDEPERIGTPHVAGSRGANQFGSYTVSSLSDGQNNYLTRLLRERQLPTDLKAGGMEQHIKLFRQGKLGRKSASKLIDWLLSLPESTNQVAREASEKQLAAIDSLGAQRDYDDVATVITVDKVTRGQTVSFADAKMALDVLFAAPHKSSQVLADARHLVTDGYYTVEFADGSYRTMRLRTQDTKASFRPGAQIVSFLSGSDNESSYTQFGEVHGDQVTSWKRFRDDSGLQTAVKVLFGDPSITRMAYARRSGRCASCNRTLTVPVSLNRGLGPECAKRAMG